MQTERTNSPRAKLKFTTLRQSAHYLTDIATFQKLITGEKWKPLLFTSDRAQYYGPTISLPRIYDQLLIKSEMIYNYSILYKHIIIIFVQGCKSSFALVFPSSYMVRASVQRTNKHSLGVSWHIRYPLKKIKTEHGSQTEI